VFRNCFCRVDTSSAKEPENSCVATLEVTYQRAFGSEKSDTINIRPRVIADTNSHGKM
jgi:hypothetical protein